MEMVSTNEEVMVITSLSEGKNYADDIDEADKQNTPTLQ